MQNQVPPKSFERVWDPLLRLFHWLLGVAFVIAYATQEHPLALHVWSGYVVGGLVVFRIVWGFIGPQHARFRDFLYRPREILAYLWALLRLHARRYLGHSPAGGAMVVALLLALILTVTTGLMLYGQEQHAGPLATFYRGSAAAATVITRAESDKQLPEEAEAEGSLEELHEVLANVTLALVILHVLGVLMTSLVHRENLALAMITGRKRTDDPETRP